MRRTKAEILGTYMRGIIDNNDYLRKGLQNGKVIRAWRRVAGERFTSETLSAHYSAGTLYLRIGSSMIRSVIKTNLSRYIEEINRECGAVYVKRVVLK